MAGQSFGHAIVSRNIQQQTRSNVSQPISYPAKQIAFPVKHESLSIDQDQDQNYARWEHLPYEPQSKRLKLESTPSSLTFVSQTKWKFSDSQEWPKVHQVGSKARNAAQAPREYISEARTEQSLSQIKETPHLLVPVKSKANSSNTQPNVAQVAHAYQKQSPEEPKRSDTKQKLNAYTQFQSNVTGFHPVQQEARELKTIKSPSQSDLSRAEVSKDEHGQQATNDSPARPYRHTAPATPAPLTIGPIKIIPRTKNTSNKGLSLERDSDRIAALIEEKRKANEANSFRQRLHQMQIEHQKEKSIAKPASATTDHAATTELSGLDDIQAAHHSPPRGNSNEQTTAVSNNFCPSEKIANTERHPSQRGPPVSDSTQTTVSQTAEIAHCNIRNQTSQAKLSRNQGPQNSGTAETANTVYDPLKTMDAKMNLSLVIPDDGRNGVTNNSTSVAKRTASHGMVATGPTRTGMANPTQPGGFSSTKDNSSTTVSAQIVTATDQIIASSNKPQTAKEKSLLNGTSSMSKIRSDQSLRSSSHSQSETQQSHPTSINQERNSAVLLSHTSSPSGFHFDSRYDSTLAAQPTQAQAVESNQSNMQYVQARTHPRFVPTLHATGRAPTYYNINQNFYLGPVQVNTSQSNTFNTLPLPSTRSNILAGLPKSAVLSPHNVRSPPYTHSSQSQVQNQNAIHNHATPRNLPHPPTLASNMNMFIGQPRAPTNVNTKNDVNRKERVNMFMRGNSITGHSPIGAGMVMGMEEIRRGIEMT